MNQEIQNPTPTEATAKASAAPVTSPEPDQLYKELAELKDKHLRLAADYENFKRRSRQEGESKAAAQKEQFIQELLPVIDNLERALASGSSADSKQFHQGVEMTLQQLRLLLRQHDIESEDVVGQVFNPHHHEAVTPRHDPDQPDHTILEMFQRGYRRGTKVIRPARVAVNDLTHRATPRTGR